jgi:hypothetical protein
MNNNLIEPICVNFITTNLCLIKQGPLKKWMKPTLRVAARVDLGLMIQILRERSEFGPSNLVLLEQGGVHTFVVNEEDQNISHSQPQFSDFLLTKENSVRMLWLIPQFLVITGGEILFSVTALEFSFYQAPISMKSVVQAVFLMSDAIGNIIIIVVAGANVVDQTREFFLFGCLMILDMILLSFLACRFT